MSGHGKRNIFNIFGQFLMILIILMLIRSLAHVVSSSGGRWVGWPGQGLKVRFGKDHDDYDHNHESPRDGHDHECWPGQGLKVLSIVKMMII